MSTNIDDLLSKFTEDQQPISKDTYVAESDERTPEQMIFDFSLPKNVRMDALNKYYELNPNDTLEIISRLTIIYCMSQISLMRKYIFEIAMFSDLPLLTRIECANTLIGIKKSEDLGLKCLDKLFPRFNELATPVRLEYILALINSGKYLPHLETLYKFVNDTSIRCEYRYKTILSLKNKVELGRVTKQEEKDENGEKVVYQVCEDEGEGFRVMLIACQKFIEFDDNEIMYKILACQNILVNREKIVNQKLDEEFKFISLAEETLVEFMNNKDLAHNLRADASDIVLRHCSDDLIQSASNTIKELGGEDALTIYDNKENVHTETIDESVMDIIKYLDSISLDIIPTFKVISENITQMAKDLYTAYEIREHRETLFAHSLFNIDNINRFDKYVNQKKLSDNSYTKMNFHTFRIVIYGNDYPIEDIALNTNNETVTIWTNMGFSVHPFNEIITLQSDIEFEASQEKIKSSLKRIELDRTIFGPTNHTLESLLLILYTHIQTHSCKDELNKRLLEELVDMANTCTSGYVSRLVNILSGFGEHSLGISWEDQIAANLAGRMNAAMKDDENVEEILLQMTNTKLKDRSAFFKFFRENISKIKEEMYDEFQWHMEDSEWDLYFRKALINYEK